MDSKGLQIQKKKTTKDSKKYDEMSEKTTNLDLDKQFIRDGKKL